MSGGGGDEMDGRWGLVGGRGKGPSVAAALSFWRRRRQCGQKQSERETNEKRDDVGVAAETRRMDGGGWLVGEGRVHRSRLRCRFGVAPHCRRRVRAEYDQSQSERETSQMRDEAMGAVAQRATVPRECESEIEQRLWASASWVITIRLGASFWVCRCR